MIHMVLGGSSSGKSDFAEGLACRYSGPKCYLATMTATDPESLARIQKHQKSREDKGFFTVEQGKNLGNLQLKTNLILLECLGNLVANEMFSSNSPSLSPNSREKKILKDLFSLHSQSETMIIVGNDVFRGNISEITEETTLQYFTVLGRIQQILASEATTVTELVYGIPMVLKGEISKL